jgi:hypothetical protein
MMWTNYIYGKYKLMDDVKIDDVNSLHVKIISLNN